VIFNEDDFCFFHPEANREVYNALMRILLVAEQTATLSSINIKTKNIAIGFSSSLVTLKNLN
jgi:hypothetical protein